MSTINPYINFDGKCREAMSFYQTCLGGNLEMQAIGDSPIAHECPAGAANDIMHAMLHKGGLVVMGSDMQGPEGTTHGNNVSLNVNCDSEEELTEYFSKFSAGGKVTMAPEKTFWGATFACLKDKYGINWQFNYTHPTAN